MDIRAILAKTSINDCKLQLKNKNDELKLHLNPLEMDNMGDKMA